MSVWLITTGSSDVQLHDDCEWNEWLEEVRASLREYSLAKSDFPATRSDDTDGVPYRVAARILGLVYETLEKAILPNLRFPLLEQFVLKVKDEQIDRIVLLVSDQSGVFGEDDRRSHSPYWQDTYGLLPMLESYLQQFFPMAKIEPVVLEPESADKGLDNWDAVLNLVHRQIKGLGISAETVYVSHQAGTPAISSAVQFSSLAQFGTAVKFLVSSEYSVDRTDLLESSRYLKFLRIQEARALLQQYEYGRVAELILPYLEQDNTHDVHLTVLLEAATQWNFAEFQTFSDKLQKSPNLDFLVRIDYILKNAQEWWWPSYESAYLAIVRLQQQNSVDAMFHSFRAVEGVLSDWLNEYHEDDISDDRKVILKDGFTLPRGETVHVVNAYGQGLYYAFVYFKKPQNKPFVEARDLTTFGKKIIGKRNEIFHKLRGMNGKDAVFRTWEIKSGKEQDWSDRILNCLNVVSGQQFLALADASLMKIVHEEIEFLLGELLNRRL